MTPHAGLWLELERLRAAVRVARRNLASGDYSEPDVAIVNLVELLEDVLGRSAVPLDLATQVQHVLGDDVCDDGAL